MAVLLLVGRSRTVAKSAQGAASPDRERLPLDWHLLRHAPFAPRFGNSAPEIVRHRPADEEPKCLLSPGTRQPDHRVATPEHRPRHHPRFEGAGVKIERREL